MAVPAVAMTQTYSYADYLGWDDAERWEIINGIAYAMTPAPSPRHQDVSGNIFLQVGNYLAGKSCKIYAAPFDVRLPEYAGAGDEDTDTVVQPDIVVICDRAKIDGRGCKGAPDLIAEILSPATAAKDMKIKLNLYEKSGVREYWIVDPVNNIIQACILLPDGTYGKPRIYAGEDIIKPSIFTDLSIELTKIFAL